MRRLDEVWFTLTKPHMRQGANVPMQLSRELLEASLLYLLPGDRNAEQVVQHIQSLCAALPRRGGSLRAEQTGLLASEAFLYALSDVAHRYYRTAIRRHAAACLRYVAMQRGLTRHQLESRLVPSCGLDRGGIFDYGPRRFTLGLGNQHTPLMRDAGGRLHTSPPRPRSSDDVVLVARARELWPTYKRRLAEASRTQTARLEQAMIDGLRWPPAEFARDIVGHPLLAELARRLVWAGYDAQGALLEGFCLADDRSLASETYQTVDLERYAAIGLPHVRTNSAAQGPVLEDVARPDPGGLTLLRDAADAMRLSARGYHRVLRVARTLADLDGEAKVGRVHLAEALSYRALADEVRRAA